MSVDGNQIQQTPLRAPRHVLEWYAAQKDLLGFGTRNGLISGALSYMKDELEAMPEEQRVRILERLAQYNVEEEP